MKNIHVMNPYLLRDFTDKVTVKLGRCHCKGGGGGGSAEYERQLQEQRQATERAEAEAARLKGEQDKVNRRRKERAQASLLTPDEGMGDTVANVRRSVLGAGS